MLRKLRESKNEEGFTLIELLVVVLIIGILAAIAIPVFLDQRQKAYANAVESDVRNLALVAEDYASDNSGVYSGTLADYDFETSEGVTLTIAAPTTGGYCIQGSHVSLASDTWAFDATSGSNAKIIKGATC